MLILILLLVFSNSQNFNFIQISDMHIGYSDEMVPLYEKVVEKVNSLIDEFDPQFALITGDHTHYTTKEELDLSFNITTQLKIPFFPIMGNHDIGHKEEIPDGDFRFYQKFKSSVFENPKYLENKTIEHYTGSTGVQYHKNDSRYIEYLQNYQLSFFDSQLIFIMLDWNNRDRSIPKLKAGANLHDYPGGTFPWFKDRLKDLSSNSLYMNKTKLIFMVQHHPFMCPLYIPCGKASFDEDKLEKMQKAIYENGKELFLGDKRILWGDLSGHMHMFYYYKFVFPGWENKFVEYMDSATRMSGAFAMIRVENWKVKSIYQYCVACPKEGQLTIINL